jgi:hypothetical protein
MNVSNLMEAVKIVNALPPAADAAGRTGVVISLKNANTALIVCNINQGNAATVTLSPLSCTTVEGNPSAIPNNVAIWYCANTATSDALVRQASDAVSFTTDATVANKIVVFEIDPAIALDVTDGYVCLAVSTGVSNAANITAANYIINPRYGQNYNISALTD